MKFFVGESRFEANGAGGGVNLVINDGQFALVERGAIVTIDRDDRQLMAGAKLLLDLPQILFWQGEDDRDRPQLCDYYESV